MPPLLQENQGVGLFGAKKSQEILSITFVAADIWTVGETEQHQHELQRYIKLEIKMKKN